MDSGQGSRGIRGVGRGSQKFGEGRERFAGRRFLQIPHAYMSMSGSVYALFV